MIFIIIIIITKAINGLITNRSMITHFIINSLIQISYGWYISRVENFMNITFQKKLSQKKTNNLHGPHLIGRKNKRTKIPKTREAMPTKLGVHAFGITPTCMNIFEIQFFDPHGL